MSNQSEADRTRYPQATVWPPPPHVPSVELVADPYQQEDLSSRRYLNEAIFLFVGGCVFPFLGFLLSTITRQIPPLMSIFDGLHYLWPVFYMAAAYFGMRAILLARRAKQSGLQVQGFIITVLSLLLAFVSLSMVLL